MSETTAREAVPDISGPEKRITALKRAASRTPWQLRDLLALDDFARHAKWRLPPMIYHYVAGSVETGAAMRGAAEAYADYAFMTRVFRDVSSRDQGATLFGKRYESPFGIAPIGGAAFIAYRGDLVLAEAARRAGIPMILSASSLIKLEEVHAQNPDAWYQAYLPGDQGRIDRVVDRVAAAGFPVFVVTADAPMLGNREHNIRTGFSMPIKVTPWVLWQSITHPRWSLGVVARTFIKHGAPHFENTDAERGPPMMSQGSVRNTLDRDRLTWRNIEAIRVRWKGKLVIKGILSPQDAKLAREMGADGVILSNHGGRQLDHTIAPLDSLAQIVAEKGAMSIMIDGGIRRGTEVMKAFALGADFVFVGRPMIFAAAIGGVPGVEHAIRLLSEEIDRDLALLGVRSVADLEPGFLRRREKRQG